MSVRLERTPVPEQKPLERIGNFDEVTLGYTKDQAVQEATRCLQCKQVSVKLL